MNASQTKAINRFRKDLLEWNRDFFIADWRVDDDEADPVSPSTLVFVSCDLHHHNDNGTTMLSLCREHWFIQVGPKGAIQVHSAPRSYEQFAGRRALGLNFRNDALFN
jgi:hypothetical protein